MDNKFELYKQLNSSGVGKDLLEWIDAEYQRTITKAVKSPQGDPEGYLKVAYGILIVKQHIESMAAGTQVKK